MQPNVEGLTDSKNPSANSAPSAVKGLVFTQASSPAQIAQARELFLEYAQSLGFSLGFQNFDHELADLPSDYATPDGRLLLAEFEGQLAGCVALHKLVAKDDANAGSRVLVGSEVCEMKRLYLRPQFRGKGLGRALADRIISEARAVGYKRMRLDTVEPVMKDAVEMYRRLGFYEIAPYCNNPMSGALYMELAL
jgi:putative acetyltransferase